MLETDWYLGCCLNVNCRTGNSMAACRPHDSVGAAFVTVNWPTLRLTYNPRVELKHLVIICTVFKKSRFSQMHVLESGTDIPSNRTHRYDPQRSLSQPELSTCTSLTQLSHSLSDVPHGLIFRSDQKRIPKFWCQVWSLVDISEQLHAFVQ